MLIIKEASCCTPPIFSIAQIPGNLNLCCCKICLCKIRLFFFLLKGKIGNLGFLYTFHFQWFHFIENHSLQHRSLQHYLSLYNLGLCLSEDIFCCFLFAVWLFDFFFLLSSTFYPTSSCKSGIYLYHSSLIKLNIIFEFQD